MHAETKSTFFCLLFDVSFVNFENDQTSNNLQPNLKKKKGKKSNKSKKTKQKRLTFSVVFTCED